MTTRLSSSSSLAASSEAESGTVGGRRQRPQPLTLTGARSFSSESLGQAYVPDTPFDLDAFLATRRDRLLEELRTELEVLQRGIQEHRLDLLLDNCEQLVHLPSSIDRLPEQVHDADTVAAYLEQRLQSTRDTVGQAYREWDATQAALVQQRAVARQIRRLLALEKDMDTLEESLAHIERCLDSRDEAEYVMRAALLERATALFAQITSECVALQGYALSDGLELRLGDVQKRLSVLLVGALKTALQAVYSLPDEVFLAGSAIVENDTLVESVIALQRVHQQKVARQLLIDMYIEPYFKSRLSLKVYAEQRVRARPSTGKHPLLQLLDTAYEGITRRLACLENARSTSSSCGFAHADIMGMVWPVMAGTMEANLAFLQDLDEPDRFSEHYHAISRWIPPCQHDAAESKREKQWYMPIHVYLSHWPLDDYFTIRFGEITAVLNGAIIHSDQVIDDAKDLLDLPALQATTAVLAAMEQCWSERVLLDPLIPRFWKLTCQLLIRYGTWLAGWAAGQVDRATQDSRKRATFNVATRAMSPLRRPSSRGAVDADAGALAAARKCVAEADIDWLRGGLVDLLQRHVRPALPEAMQGPSLQLLEELMAKVAQLELGRGRT
ncbi:hypothetical protein THASP1DRAFT_28302 [Thamnocephalis sphaerospora]|uniref:COG complex component COG2 C-terminal domain-containing protein n=1 Tax=Thamnocephalis sphaerospora TaxID=78915 RepID=A0A4P9XUJ2_9FUNG|nr:hypothetical protein THASP1DRAFT_28302 [Thamnocephalis sphaerospora]|eukprot:RKP09904.1 hypothetical protein THASP1DRAFT_28302 [Thamnocephalis sphaerospora]